MRTLTGTISRATDLLRDGGVGAVARRVGDLVAKRLYVNEMHVWYGLDLTAERPRPQLPPDVRTELATPAQVQRVSELGQSPFTARAHFDAGNDLWLSWRGEDLLFCCWIFRDRAPVLAAPGGELSLTRRTVVLEDSFSSPKARGQGIAPASWSVIADRLQEEGIKTIVTKVETDNVPSRKAVAKAGFEEVAVMNLTRVATSKRTSVAAVGPKSDVGGEIAERLNA